MWPSFSVRSVPPIGIKIFGHSLQAGHKVNASDESEKFTRENRMQESSNQISGYAKTPGKKWLYARLGILIKMS